MARRQDRAFPDLDTRFIAKVTVSETGCWLWGGYVDPKGYGIFGVGGQKLSRAHRFAYERFIGPVPDGLFLDHLCRNRNCVNPHHLEVVTNQENVTRGLFFRAARKACRHGHLLTEDNTYIDPRGVKCCRECRREASAKHRNREKTHARS